MITTDKQKLYRVRLKGMCSSVSGTCYGIPYVIAHNPTEALKKVQDYIEERDLGFQCDREMDRIELLAEEGDHPECKIQMYL